jgi:radical SAM protein with 4Fe4S-binding SPASM domain
MYYFPFSNIITVKGYNRALLVDLEYSEFKFIPNSLSDFIDELRLFPIEEIKDKYKHESETFNDYINFLDKYKYFTKTNEITKFPKLNLNWDKPSLITSINIKYTGSYNILEVFELAYKLNSPSIKIEVSNESDLLYIIDKIIFEKINTIEFVIQKCSINVLKEIVKYPKLTHIFLGGSFGIDEREFDHEKIYSYDGLTFRSFETFNASMDYFTEAMSYNPYYNKKIFIDDKGKLTVGSFVIEIEDIKSNKFNLKEIIKKSKNVSEWGVSKSQIEVCKDCEFRFICQDDRKTKEGSSNNYYFDSECNYNPYIGKWKGDNGYRSLVECGVIGNQEGFKIDYVKINKVNSELWEE